jgi:hypothetical protein
VLPVELSFFEGNLSSGITSLKWKTENEINLSHFIIQRSINGIDFINIGRVNKTTTTNLSSYRFEDRGLPSIAPAKVYYRLSMEDMDQSRSFSKIISIDRIIDEPQIQIFPNPAINTITVDFNEATNGATTVNIYDMKGAVVKSQRSNLVNGRVSMQIDIRQMPPGVYLLKAKNGQIESSQKFMRL